MNSHGIETPSWQKIFWGSLALAVPLWIFFSWPLPRYIGEGIPASTANVEKNGVRRMFQGDHLQLLYNYWLTADMLAGKTPWFHNVYEFNLGDDSTRKYVGIDDAPFVFVFAALQSWTGRAFAWNATGFVAIWLTLFFSWLLLCHYVSDLFISGAAASVAVTLPYRWTSLFGGSPTGFAMTWIPLWMWGLDAALRRGRILGGLMAGLAIAFASWNDAHVFFFSVLAIPCWICVVLLLEPAFPWRDRQPWRRAIIALLPFVLLAGGVVLIGQLKHAGLEETTFHAGKEWREVALYSPRSFGLYRWRAVGREAQIYLGWVLPAFLLVGLLSQAWRTCRAPREQWRRMTGLVLLIMAAAVIVGLALGTLGPGEGLLLRAARKLIPPYGMIRQPAKIFCLLPNLLALAFAMTGFGLAPSASRIHLRFGATLIAMILSVEYGLQIRPTICLLDTQQGAYAAVAEDARARGVAPRAIVLPIWPGDSSWSSLYEHYVSLYRIRMINGYQPAVSRDYVENVFATFKSFNCGLLDDFQREALRRYGVDYVLLHEDAFPEKVSWFPVAFTLKKLLNHPYLELLEQDQNVWAFRIRNAPRAVAVEALPHWAIFFPNFHHEMEWTSPIPEMTRSDDTASGGRYVGLTAETSEISLPPFEHLRAPNPRLLLRHRGNADLVLVVTCDEQPLAEQHFALATPDWSWLSIPLPDFANSWRISPRFRVAEGSADLDLLLYAAGELPKIMPGDSFKLPAPLFFHAGFTDLQTDSVFLRRDREPADIIVYGPKLPFPEGDYEITCVFDATAAPGTELGSFFVETEPSRTETFPVVAGQAATGYYSSRAGSLPATLRFRYTRNADMRLRSFQFTRLK